MEENQRQYSFSSDDSDTADIFGCGCYAVETSLCIRQLIYKIVALEPPEEGLTTSWSRCSKMATTKNSWSRQKDKKPSEVFRTDLITAMKIPDSCQLGPDEYYILADPWRQEWEKGVQVPANMEAVPDAEVRVLYALEEYPLLISSSASASSQSKDFFRTRSLGVCRYDLDEIDTCWMDLVNMELKEMEIPELDEPTLEKVMEELEMMCYQNMNMAIDTEEGLGIEYDEDVVCDVCRSPEGEDGNEMVFCDKCNVCVHQACYGILKVPTGSWLCRTCALGVQPKCLLCPKRGGALKPTRSGTKWVHVSCALWIPEVSIGCPEKMEPITKISHIPANRWALSCSLCKECTGTCIQCSMPFCITAFHVTCAFDNNLEMRTILAENDEVKFKSFCFDHSSGTTKPEDSRIIRPAVFASMVETDQSKQDLEKVTLRKQKLQQLEEDFYELVNPSEVADNLDIKEMLVDFIYQYWKLKRKANFNKPLMSPKTDEIDNLAQQEQDVLYRRLKLFTHLRQDLERVRNLCYMVTRREKMKHSVCKFQEQIFKLQMKIIEKDLCQEQSGKRIKGKKNELKSKANNIRRSSRDKEKMKLSNESVLGQLDLSTSFPIDGTFFNSWLAQSVQITTGNIARSQWSLNNGHHENSNPGLLSKELLQDEETLLSFMMDHSLKSSFRQTEAVRRVKNKAKINIKKKYSRNGIGTIFKNHQEDSNETKYVSDHSIKSFNHDSQTNKTGKGTVKLHVDRKGNSEVKKTAKRGLTTSGSQFSFDLTSAVTNGKSIMFPQSESNMPRKVPVAVDCSKTVLKIKLTKEGKANGESLIQKTETANEHLVDERSEANLHFDNENDGYFSDAEMSDSDKESGSGTVHLNQLDSGNEDTVRMSILAS
ncbi:E3 ubiquitin-protein ligase Jade-2 isoform X2 [Ambystoma mexicanum]|uniref:E3 ubiquitin-protein ligase Jade-2 isoform X2 n=1 Tax=Ambystoma mexicanum TaxID=8296 RepID=UPI0037E8425E